MKDAWTFGSSQVASFQRERRGHDESYGFSCRDGTLRGGRENIVGSILLRKSLLLSRVGRILVFLEVFDDGSEEIPGVVKCGTAWRGNLNVEV